MMKQSPITYWRNQQKQKKLLDKKGKIVSLTNVVGTTHHSGIVKIGQKKIMGQIIATTRKPKIDDQVIGVLRINSTNGKAGFIEYGVKFQLSEEVLGSGAK